MVFWYFLRLVLQYQEIEVMGSENIDQQTRGGYVSDEVLGTFIPIVVYWVYSGLYLMLGGMDNYRLHSQKDEDEKNLVSKKEVVKGVLLQQVVQAAVATLLFTVSYFDDHLELLQSFDFYLFWNLLCIMMNWIHLVYY